MKIEYSTNPAGTNRPFFQWSDKPEPYDSSHWDSIFNGTDYEDSYKSILHQYENAPDGTFLGAITGQNTANLYNHNQAREQALVALQEQMRSDKYNSESSQVERQRQAGLNPDLLGVSGDSSSSSAVTKQPNQMLYENPIPHIVSFMTMLGNAALGAQQFHSQDLANEGMELQNIVNAKTLALQALGNISPESGDLGKKQIQPAINGAYPFARQRTSDKLNKYASALYGSIEHEIAYRSNAALREFKRKELFDNTSYSGYSPDDEVMREVAIEIANQQLLINRANYNLTQKGIKSESLSLDNKNTNSIIYRDAFESQQGFIAKLRKWSKNGSPLATRILLRMTTNTGNFGNSANSAVGNLVRLIKK